MEQVTTTTTRSPNLAALLAAYRPWAAGSALAEAVADERGYGALEREPWTTWPMDAVRQGPGDDEDEDEGEDDSEGEDSTDTWTGTPARLGPSSAGRRRARRP
jgi:hypothetical protein